MTDRRRGVSLPNPPVVNQMAAKRTQGTPHQQAQRPVQQIKQTQMPSGISVVRAQAAPTPKRQMPPPMIMPKPSPISVNISAAGARPLVRII